MNEDVKLVKGLDIANCDGQMGLSYLDRGVYRTFAQSVARARDPKRHWPPQYPSNKISMAQRQEFGRRGGVATAARRHARNAKLDRSQPVTVRF